MKLNEFVEETIREIILGVQGAQSFAREHNAKVNPGPGITFSGKDYVIFDKNGNPGQVIEFDITVTTNDSTEGNIGGGIFVAGFTFGAKGKADSSSGGVNHLKFSLPVFLPYQDVPAKKTSQHESHAETDILHQLSKFT